ncbi:hypothetical protein Zmor_024732 [Zophobas morio]|uniref:Major facilitator superfamily (MFS) profile domain-containing protein n=1 Tax=Zophobas morio TaxID=2755281 RepID=A0AA38I3R0_9CUCU|nr:hypothetical protein Zmor_024732 [Zophobas morio]
MIFFTTFTNYMLRSNISVSVVAMVGTRKSGFVPPCKRDQIKNTTENKTSAGGKERTFDWNEDRIGWILTGYFWGYMVTLVPAGLLSELIGPWHVILWSSLASGVLTGLTPLFAEGGYIGVVISRVFIGMLGGLAYPAAHVLIAKWAPPHEKGKFVAAMLGNTIGTMVTFNLVGWVSDAWGWQWGFYVLVILMAAFCLGFFFVVADTPEKSRCTSQEERDYIQESHHGSVSKKKAVAPYLKILTSIPFWAVCAAQFGNLWGLNLILTYTPKYLSETIGFNLKESAGLASLPYLARMTASGMFGILGDWMLKKEIMSVTRLRKFFIIFSHFIPAACLFMIRVAGCNQVGVVALLILCQFFNGAVVVSHFINPQDLAPNFAGSVFGVMNFIGMTTGIFVPKITGAITTHYNKNLAGATIIYTIGGSVYFCGGLLFIIFGTAKTQPWNEIKETEPEPNQGNK